MRIKLIYLIGILLVCCALNTTEVDGKGPAGELARRFVTWLRRLFRGGRPSGNEYQKLVPKPKPAGPKPSIGRSESAPTLSRSISGSLDSNSIRVAQSSPNLASLGSAQSQNPLLKNKLQSGINKFGQGIKKGAIETGHGLVKVGKGVKKMTKKTLGNFGSGYILADSVGGITDALVDDGEGEVKFIVGQDFFSPDDSEDEEIVAKKFVDYPYTSRCNEKFESCNGTEAPEKDMESNYEFQGPAFYSPPQGDPTILHSNGGNIASNYTIIIITIFLLKLMM